jgi:hypothetical protein
LPDARAIGVMAKPESGKHDNQLKFAICSLTDMLSNS